METIILISLAALALIVLAAILKTQKQILKELGNIRIPASQKIEFPKIEFPKVEIPPVEIPPAKEYVLDLNPVIEAIKNIQIPAPQKVEFPKIEFPKLEIPPTLDLNPVIEAIKNIEIPAPQKIEFPKIEIPASSQKEGSSIDAEVLQEVATLMRVNQAEFQSSLEAFHKAIDKLLAQVPNGEKELNAQKEFMQKFEDAMRKAQETATEAMNENSLRLQEILAEVLNKEQKG